MTEQEEARSLFFRHYPELCSFASLLLADPLSARNAAVHALFLLWMKRADINTEKDCRAFLFVTVRNNCLNFLRAQQRDPRIKIYSYEPTLMAGLPADILAELNACLE